MGKLQRKLYCIANTLIPEEFKAYVFEKVSKSQTMYIDKKRMVVDAKP